MSKLMDRLKQNKKLLAIGILIIVIFLLLIFRITYAYIAARITEATGNISVNSDTTDNLSFAIGDPLSIDATPTTLPENGTNLVDTTTASATLIANSTNNTAEETYYVYLNIPNNSFVYSDGSTPEIILTITGPNGEITNIEGLTYGTFNGISGFDITVASGLYSIASEYLISSNSSIDSTVQEWNFTLTYLNLGIDQSVNFGNKMNIELLINSKQQTSNEYTLIAENTEIYGNDYTLTNLLDSVGDFEASGGWDGNCNMDTSIKKYGNYSCRAVGTSGSLETTISTTATYSLDNSHVYYARVEAFTEDTALASSATGGIYWPIQEPHFVEAVPISANDWSIISLVNNRSSFTNGTYQLRLDFNNNSVAGTIYFDGAMLIDLTQSYGANYPDKAYLDSHLMYFSGTADVKTINSITDGTFKVNNINNYNQITCTNGVTASIDDSGNVLFNGSGQDAVCRLSA